MKKQHKSIGKSEKIWSIVFISLCAAMVLTVLITLHIDGRFSSGVEEASHVENAFLNEINVSSNDVELLSDYSEITTPEDELESSIENISTEKTPGVETPQVDVEINDLGGY